MKYKSLLIAPIILIAAMISSPNLFGQNSWYVDYSNGSNSNSGASYGSAVKTVDALLSGKVKPMDTVFIIGQYNNPSYDPNFVYGGNNDRNNPHIWHQENTIKLTNLHGQPNKYITFKPYDATTVLKGDGANIIRITNSSYLRFEGLEVFGEVNHIPLSSAEGLVTDGMQFLYLAANTADEKHPTKSEVLYRVSVGTTVNQIKTMTFPIIGKITRPSYIDTRGLYMSGCNHVDIINCHIHHTPGGGLSVSESSYVTVEGNEINDCSRRSYSGTHALVVTKAKQGTANSTDDPLYSIKVIRNKVHHNFNEIFSWVGTKSFITPRIDEGKGISLQRNNLTNWQNGSKRILVANNLCFWNGFSGVHSNDGYHIDFINNTCYMNSYTNSITYTSDKKGNNIGISAQNGSDIRIINNISAIDTDWSGFALSSGGTTNLMVKDNMIFGVNGTVSQDVDVVNVQQNTMVANPKFVNVTVNDYHLQQNSPAIGAADTNFAPSLDFYENMRDNQPDLGAVEFVVVSGINQSNSPSAIQLYPNPFNNHITVDCGSNPYQNIMIYNMLGQNMTSYISIQKNDELIEIETVNLPSGMYLLQINYEVFKVYKAQN